MKGVGNWAEIKAGKVYVEAGQGKDSKTRGGGGREKRGEKDSKLHSTVGGDISSISLIPLFNE